jgi:rubrerythrin
MNFLEFKQSFQSNFKLFVKDQTHLYLTNVDKDELWNTYLNNFPEDVRQEFNCNSCKQFIKNYGNLVAIKNYETVTYWDFEAGDNKYQKVIDALKNLALSKPIKDVFVNETNVLGTDSNWDVNKEVKWNHLYYQLPNNFKTNKDIIETKKSEYRDNKSVFKRSLEELSFVAVRTVLDLIAENNLYRGQEFKALLNNFDDHKVTYEQLTSKQKDNYCWSYAVTTNALLRIRNSSIGTLLIDLSNDVDLETAIRKFEKVVAPTNYKRPKPLVTAKMVEDAQKTIEALGLSQALQRRFAVQDDITVDNVLFVNRTKSQLDIFDELKKDAIVNVRKLSNLKEVSLDNFITEVLPNSSNIELLLENKHESNLVSLLTSDDDTNLFKWSNNYSWCYRNNLTDSLKEKVKAAGGKVDGKLRISLEWYNYDDLDLHLMQPDKQHIYYRNKRSTNGGQLDVDANGGHATTRTPVENIIYPHNCKLPEGAYGVGVNQFCSRESIDVGFNVEIEYEGEIFEFNYNTSPRHNEDVVIATFTITKEGIKLAKDSKINSKKLWNLNTNTFHKVNMITYSPNYWQQQIGNKHVFFFLDDCKNTEPVRGIFNEYLKDELLVHKKVFEALGGKLQVSFSDNQLSGVGFSTTINNSFVVKVDGKLVKVTV